MVGKVERSGAACIEKYSSTCSPPPRIARVQQPVSGLRPTPSGASPSSLHASNLTRPSSPASPLQISPILLPELLHIVQHDEYGATLQRRALSILHVIVGALHLLTSSHPKEVRAQVAAMAGDWFDQFARLLAQPLGAHVSAWSANALAVCGCMGAELAARPHAHFAQEWMG